MVGLILYIYIFTCLNIALASEFYKAYLPAIEKTIERMATATPEEKKDMIKSIQRDCNRFSEVISAPN